LGAKGVSEGGLAVTTDGLNGAGLKGFLAKLLFFFVGRLFVDVGITPVIVSLKIIWGGFPTEIAIDALTINVELAFRLIR
jgi:hypothetical protein